MHTSETSAIIVGAGIGGLSAALALRRIGYEVTLLERSDDVDRLHAGTGLTIWSNAFKALRRLGLAAEIEAIGTPMRAFENRRRGGALITSWPVGEIGTRVGAPTVNVTRANLHRVLVAAVGEGVIRFGAAAAELAPADGRVSVRTADGASESAAVVVGADGLRSTVRRVLRPAAVPVYCGYSVWRGLVSLEHPRVPRGVFQQFWGPGMRFGCYYASEQELYWIAVANAREGEVDPADGVREMLVDRFRDWADPIPSIIEATDERAILRTDIAELAPLRAWGEGRVTLLGDAAHAMTFNVGQGACMAIEDAVVLAGRLERGGDVAAALRSYEAERMKRTRRQQQLAHTLGAIGRWESPLAGALRNQLWRAVISPVGVRLLEKTMAYEV